MLFQEANEIVEIIFLSYGLPKTVTQGQFLKHMCLMPYVLSPFYSEKY